MRRLRMRTFILAATWAWAGPAAAVQTNAPAADATKLTVKVIAGGLKNPWGLQFLPDGRMLVTERPGQMRIITADGKVSETVKGLPNVVNKGQGGLLDVLLAPDFATSGIVYFSYAEPRGYFTNATAVARAKLTLEGDSGSIADGVIIFRQEPAITSTYHYGSRLVFDKTGALFITTGERSSQKDSAQDLGTHLGKIIRVMPDGKIPSDNPFVGQDGKLPEIWSYGHRNIQGAAIDPATGKLWTTEHGAQGGDELNQPEARKNYGWPVITWGIDYSGAKIGEGTAKTGMEQPVYYWKPSIGTSGLAFYTGDRFKSWKGNLLAGGLSAGVVERLVMDNGQVVAVEHLLTDQQQRMRDVRVGPDGAVYVLTDDATDGRLLKLTPAG
jgi:aldose sugar dehydrogenase